MASFEVVGIATSEWGISSHCYALPWQFTENIASAFMGIGSPFVVSALLFVKPVLNAVLTAPKTRLAMKVFNTR